MMRQTAELICRNSSPQNNNPVIIYSPMCRLKPVWITFIHGTQKKLVQKMITEF